MSTSYLQNQVDINDLIVHEKQANLEEDELLQGKFKLNNETDQNPIQQKKDDKNSSIPKNVMNKMESSFNTDFTNVNIKKDSQQAIDIGALAFTQGNSVHFAPGQFKPETKKGQELIGHEFAHVVQQREGKVKANKQIGKFPINDNKNLEKQADEQGKKAADGVLQRKEKDVTVQAKGVNINDDSALEKDADIMGDRAANIKKNENGKVFDNRNLEKNEGKKKIDADIFDKDGNILFYGKYNNSEILIDICQGPFGCNKKITLDKAKLNKKAKAKIANHYYIIAGYKLDELENRSIEITDDVRYIKNYRGKVVAYEENPPASIGYGDGENSIEKGKFRLCIDETEFGRQSGLNRKWDFINLYIHERKTHGQDFLDKRPRKKGAGIDWPWERDATRAQVKHRSWKNTSKEFKLGIYLSYGRRLYIFNKQEQQKYFGKYDIELHPRK